jgi:hypothetical protein
MIGELDRRIRRKSASSGGSLRPRRHRQQRCIPLERALAREHLVENQPERELIGAEVDRPPMTCSGDM